MSASSPRIVAGISVAAILLLSLSFARSARAEPKRSSDAKRSPAGGMNFGNFSLTSAKEPIEVTSDRLEFDYNGRQAIFRGGVQVLQGDIRLGADQLTVEYAELAGGKEQELRDVIAEGNVQITQGARKATGKRAVFHQSNRTLVLSGGAMLEEGSNQVTGDTIVVYPDESKMEVKGENRRVKVILFPDRKQSGTPPLTEKTDEPGARGPS